MKPADPTWSYDRHIEQERVASQLPSCYANPESIDAWRHRRMHDSVLPLIKAFPDARWMTIGDGAYGSDAHYLMGNGADAIATSISDATLSVALEKGFIKGFRVENAEGIHAEDSAFDFVLCKEAYHHFPRPPLAFYELMRVAGKAVVLIEPIEGSPRPMDRLRGLVKKVLRKGQSSLFEESGNFIYRIDIREIEKMATSMNHRFIAFRFLNDFYQPKLAAGIYGRDLVRTSLTKLGIFAQDSLCTLGLMTWGLATVVVFKEDPSEALQDSLKKSGFQIRILPRNPYA